MKSIRDMTLRHQTVFLRVDFNVPLDDAGNITEDARVKAALPTIEYILEKGAKLIVASHLGRPKGERDSRYTLQPVAKRLSELLGQDVRFVDDCVGAAVDAEKKQLKPGEVLLLENLRFYPQEEANDLYFAQQLAEGVDVYINDAFGTIHRAHASIAALPSLVFDKGCGFLIQHEIDALSKVITNPDQPFVVLMGGIKISDKIDVIRNLAPISDIILVGGGIANAFLKATGHDIGASVVEEEAIDIARDIWRRFETEHSSIHAAHAPELLHKIQVPVDFIAAASAELGAEQRVIEIGVDTIPAGWKFLDIGPKTRTMFGDVLHKAKTIFWNGPLGVFEVEPFSHGSREIAQIVAQSSGYAVLGGGDTESVVAKFGLEGRFEHVSTGGGASLAFLAQKELPGLRALE
jgi:phosphoglycerate kinase